VVRGARLAQDAGVALEEIENVSSSLAELIQNISNAARQQASSAGHISNTMNVIQEITTQTSAGTSATAQSIGNLAEMALDLRESVAGFKLPEEDVMSESPGHNLTHKNTSSSYDLASDVDLDMDVSLLDDDIYPHHAKA
jgi:twitching motility protein PilJ